MNAIDAIIGMLKGTDEKQLKIVIAFIRGLTE